MLKTVEDIATKYLPRGRPGEPETRVLQSAIDRKAVSRDISREPLGIGDSLADSIARVGGSWGFIVTFLVFLVLWTLANAWLLGRDTFDPYPFVFLNLVLSMLAAIQAPIIMMAQNRQAEHDRIDAEHDYEVNLKAEIEIMALHDKLDALRETEIQLLREQVARLAGELQGLREAIGR